jgi:hypothetical protein
MDVTDVEETSMPILVPYERHKDADKDKEQREFMSKSAMQKKLEYD